MLDDYGCPSVPTLSLHVLSMSVCLISPNDIYLPTALYKKPLIALAHMITRPHEYVPDTPGKSTVQGGLPDITE